MWVNDSHYLDDMITKYNHYVCFIWAISDLKNIMKQ